MLEVYHNAAEITSKVAHYFLEAARSAIASRGKFTVALTGGSSPVEIYKLLATPAYAESIDWAKVFVFWGDERWVPFEDDRSNTKMAFETLLNHVNIPKENIFPMYQEGVTPEDYAVVYENNIREIVGKEGKFDLILLGMGDDGHTASLFPGTKVLQENVKWVDAYFLESQDMYRITLTAPLLNKAHQLIVITFGEKKAHALKEVLSGTYQPELYPTQLLKPEDGTLVFTVDKLAAGQS
ncbi:6-phosphogluconolactonase [Sphingobacterium sp. LRF_L2]|uniref:6-phosphogluconolactonase n=1 Tax=Sphingobacterium sp. LRF_L2 TaxID=3369421 RepID=UPI003F5FD17A